MRSTQFGQFGVFAAVLAITGPACASKGTANSPDRQGTVTCLIDGDTFSSTRQVEAMRSGGVLSVSADDEQTIVTFSIAAHSTGTFPFGGLDAASGRVQILTQTWQAVGLGTGQVVVTTFTDSSATGTFAFTALPVESSGAADNKVITDGAFNVTF